jgi:hypothetical protein
MTAWLRQQGEAVNHKRVARIIRQIGIQAIYPKPRTTIAGMLAGIPTCWGACALTAPIWCGAGTSPVAVAQ